MSDESNSVLGERNEILRLGEELAEAVRNVVENPASRKHRLLLTEPLDAWDDLMNDRYREALDAL